MKISSAACELFCEKGYSATSTSEIAKRAEVSEGTIFKYFATKKDLLLYIATYGIEMFAEDIAIKPLVDLSEKYSPAEKDVVIGPNTNTDNNTTIISWGNILSIRFLK